jgi:lipoprotein-releasing system permease protein
MFYPLSLFIGLRYNRGRRRNGFISFISLMSMLGIALGVAVLITVLSVMNGFDQQIRERVFGMAPHLSLMRYGGISDWQSLLPKLSHPQVLHVAPYVEGQGMLYNLGQVNASFVYGIEPALEAEVSILPSKMIAGNLKNLRPKEFGIVIGEQMAMNLGAVMGDKIVVVTPQVTSSIAGISTVLKRFTVVGIFRVGKSYGFDSSTAFINIKDAQALYRRGELISGLRIQLQDLYQSTSVAHDLARNFTEEYQFTDWKMKYGSFFEAIATEKNIQFLLLLLLVAIAAFNLVSTLVMVVTEKQSDIAILRTLGATPALIMRVFMVQGTLIGFVGTTLGVVGGVALAWNVTAVFEWCQQLFNTRILDSDAFWLNYLPSKLEWIDVLQITLMSLLMSVLATLYPAWRASRVQPAEALRYE